MEKDTEPLVTVGLGPDFAIFRSKNVKLDFPRLVKVFAKKLPHANIEGGGHEIVGSLKFITGAREDLIQLIREQLTLITISDLKE
jgi:RecJ-like exonuclease